MKEAKAEAEKFFEDRKISNEKLATLKEYKTNEILSQMMSGIFIDGDTTHLQIDTI